MTSPLEPPQARLDCFEPAVAKDLPVMGMLSFRSPPRLSYISFINRHLGAVDDTLGSGSDNFIGAASLVKVVPQYHPSELMSLVNGW